MWYALEILSPILVVATPVDSNHVSLRLILFVFLHYFSYIICVRIRQYGNRH